MATYLTHPTPSLAEAVLRAVHTTLVGAGTLAGQRVERGRRDAFGLPDLMMGPAIAILRGDGAFEPFGEQADRADVSFSLHLWAQGADWESTADALHVQCHTALLANAHLARLGRGLHCTDTDATDRPGENPMGRLTAKYRLANIVTRATLAPLTPA